MYGQRVSTSVIFYRYWQIPPGRNCTILYSHKPYINVQVSLEHCPRNLLSNFYIFASRWEMAFWCSFNLCIFYYKWGWASFHFFKCPFIFIFMSTMFWTLYIFQLCSGSLSLFLRALYILSSMWVANSFSQTVVYVLIHLWWFLFCPLKVFSFM